MFLRIQVFYDPGPGFGPGFRSSLKYDLFISNNKFVVKL